MSGKPAPPPEERVEVFDEFLLKERLALKLPCGKEQLAEPCGSALAISGGGIRSASFALGVIQTFLNETPGNSKPESGETCFDRFDYMSTVSGGGYIGGAVSWLKHHFGKGGSWRTYLGASDLGARSAEFHADGIEGVDGSKFTWLDYFRQHGNYLKPSSFSTMSLVGVALRGMLITMSVYTAILAAILWGLQSGGVLPPAIGEAQPWAGHPQRIESFLLFLGLIAGGAFLLFGIASWLGSIPTKHSVRIGVIPPFLFVVAGVWVLWSSKGGLSFDHPELHWRWPVAAGFLVAAGACSVLLWWSLDDYGQARNGTHVVHKWQYRVRILYQQVLGPLLTGLTLIVAVWSVPIVYRLIHTELGALQAGATSSLLGVAGAIYQFVAGRDKKSTASKFATVRILITAVLLVYGILMMAYWVVQASEDHPLPIGNGIPLMAIISVLGVLLGFIVNANYIGIGRMYRDRLMELFLPDKEAIRDNQWRRAGNADQFDLTKLVDEDGAPQRPMHLVNCNVVMVGAKQDRFRGRGGDSFVLSPRFCGSSATGWVETSKLGDGHFTLATAVASSGAAASPHAGVAGRGITRNPLVSLLLSLTNVRLGYWIRNPRASQEPKDWHKWFPPNLLLPGIRQGLFGSGTTENAFFIELTDGGHFDNTGLYELIRRRVKIIVLSQGSQDLKYSMDDLANVIQRVRVDFGVHIRFTSETYPLSAMRPPEEGTVVKRGWALGSIKYPGTDSQGILLYLQASPIAGMNADTASYWRRNFDFPNQTTADQFFDEEQLEAYRELGMGIAQTAVKALKGEHEPWDEPMTALRKTFGW